MFSRKDITVKVGKKIATFNKNKHYADFALEIEECSVVKTEVATILEVKDGYAYSLLKNIWHNLGRGENMTVNVLNKDSLTMGHFTCNGTTANDALVFVISQLLEISAGGEIIRQKSGEVPLVYLRIYP